MMNESPFDESSHTAIMTRQEVACLKTALALVVVKRRLQQQKGNDNQATDESHQTKKRRQHIPLIQGFSLSGEHTTTTNGDDDSSLRSTHRSHNKDERCSQHLSHMMELALKQVEYLESQQQQSPHKQPQDDQHATLRLESLVTHVACQLQAWNQAADVSNGMDLPHQESQQQQQQQQRHSKTSNADIVQWIHGHLLLDKPTTFQQPSQTISIVRRQVHLWTLILPIQPKLVSQWLVPMLLEWLLGVLHHPTTTTTSTVSPTIVGHYWSLLETAFQHASVEACQEALQTLMVWNHQQAQPKVLQDLPGHFLAGPSHFLLRWAMRDLMDRLLVRLSSMDCNDYDA